MIVAIPMGENNRVYHQNPCTSPSFAMYEVKGRRDDIRYRYLETKANPWKRSDGDMLHDPVMKACECGTDVAGDIHHVSEHYVLLEAIGRCNYMIVDQYCLNTLHALKNVGIKIHKVPPFVKTAEEAINHFIIGAEIADNLQNIHPAS